MKQNFVRREEHCGFGRGNRFDKFFQGSKVPDGNRVFFAHFLMLLVKEEQVGEPLRLDIFLSRRMEL